MPVAKFLILLAVLGLSAQGQPPAKRLDVRSLGAKGDGATDDQGAIAAAIAALAKRGGGTLFFPAGVYLHSDTLIVSPNISVQGVGNTSILKALNPARAALQIVNETNCSVQDLKIVGVLSPRLRSAVSVALLLKNDIHCVVQRVSVDGGASAAILVSGSEDIQILHNDVRNTMADGIHVVGGSRNVLVANNVAFHTGDDSFAAVSYLGTRQTANVTIKDNVTTDGQARGATCIGALNCVIEGNTIINPKSSGINVATETGYHTYRPSGAVVEGNKIESAKGANSAGIMVNYADNVKIGHNELRSSKFVLVNGSKGVSMTGLDLEDSIGPGIMVTRSQDIQITDSHVARSSGSGITFDTVTGGEVARNKLEDVRSSSSDQNSDVEITKSSLISGEGNISSHRSSPGRHGKELRVSDSDSTVKVASK
jgi:hypothetical protein